MTSGGTHYTITSTAQYKSDSTGTASCTSSSAKADYIETTSTVTWPAIGKSAPVVETGIVSPPADSALIVQVLGASGEPVSKMTVQATGPSTITTETSTDGCAILAVSPGEYALNVSRSGYVDQYGYTESNKDPHYSSSFYVIAESTAKKSFEFAPAGAIEAKFTGANAEGDTFVAFNALTTLKEFGKLESYHGIENPRHDTLSIRLEVHGLRRQLRSRPTNEQRAGVKPGSGSQTRCHFRRQRSGRGDQYRRQKRHESRTRHKSKQLYRDA